MKISIHAVIVSWEGMHEQAAAIARALEGHVDRLTVIYSNTAGEPETGAGNWQRVPQEWFFGLKFARALAIHPPGSVMLQINADASSDAWPHLVRRLEWAFATHPDIGVWAPDIDWTPWPTELVAEGIHLGGGLESVSQTDGIVWAMAPVVLDRLRRLDYHANNLGWGIDWAAIAFAKVNGLHVVRDTAVLVQHPEGRGYSYTEAAQNLKVFVGQLTPDEQNWFGATYALLRRKGAGQSEEEAGDAPASLASFMLEGRTAGGRGASSGTEEQLMDRIAAVYIIDRKVLVVANTPLEGRNVFLEAGSRELSLEPCNDDDIKGRLPRGFPLEGGCATVGFQVALNGHGVWQVASWATLRIVAETGLPPARLRLKGHLDLTATQSSHLFKAALAVHRGKGSLVVVASDLDGGDRQEFAVAFEPRFDGGDSPRGYQAVQITLPAFKRVKRITLELDYGGPNSAEKPDPPVFFIANPSLVMVAQTAALERVLNFERGSTNSPVWYEVDVPPLTRPDIEQLTLAAGSERMVLMEPQRLDIAIVREEGPLLELQASADLQAVIWVDGAPAFRFHFLPRVNVLRLPARYLTGQHRLLEVRDEIGLRVFWSTWVRAPRQATAIDVLTAERCSPYPDLFAQSAHRFLALRTHCAAGVSGQALTQLTQAIAALEAGPATLKLLPFSFPDVAEPEASVIVCARGTREETYACLSALLLARNEARFEVIIVGDGISAQGIEDVVSGVRVRRHEAQQGWVRAINAAAAEARGPVLALLDGRSEPTVGWLDELLAALGGFDHIGAAGAKLLRPDGRLQAAGGIVWNSGDALLYGRGENPWEPRFGYARRVDYVPSAALAITRAVWSEVGGLSGDLEPLELAEVDFAFRLGAAGYDSWFVPSSVVFVGAADREPAPPEASRLSFKRRWAVAYAGHGKSGVAPDQEKDRGIVGRVLVLVPSVPMPDQGAVGYAAGQEVRLIQSLGYKVTLLAEDLAYRGRYTHALEKSGVEVIASPFCTSVDTFLEQRAREFDAFYVCGYEVVNSTVSKIRSLLPQASVIMSGTALHYLRLLRRAIQEENPEKVQAARQVRTEEFNAMRSVDLVLCANENERAVIEALSEGGVRQLVAPWVLEAVGPVPPRERRSGLSFLGGSAQMANVEGLEWFAEQVMGPLEQQRSGLTLSVYGARVDERVRRLASTAIRIEGFIEDAAAAYAPHLVFIAPQLSGGAMKGAVLGALAHGLPTVISPSAAADLGLRDGEECLIAETCQEWVDKIQRLLDDAELWERLRTGGQEFVRARYSFARGREQMQAVFEAVGLFKFLASRPLAPRPLAPLPLASRTVA